MEYEVNKRILEIRESLNMTQTEFGKSVGVSRGVISNIDLGIVDASTKPLLLEQIAKIHKVDPYWLETGEGDMFMPQTKDDAIMEFLQNVLSEDDESFRRRFVEMLASLDDDGWLLLEKMLDTLYPHKTKKEQE